jgi:DNA-binding response OmpR family regulator
VACLDYHYPVSVSAIQQRSSRILIVEDELVLAKLIAEAVISLGYTVSGIACNLAEGRDEFGRRNFDAVLLDIGLDGHRSREIADVLLERRTPFAFVTAYDEAAEPRHARVPLLHKPFNYEQLEVLLKTLVGEAPHL